MRHNTLRNRGTITFVVVLVLLCVVFSSFISCSCSFIPVYEVTDNTDSYSIHSEWTHKSAVWRYDIEIQKAVYEDFSFRDRVTYPEYVMDPDDDEFMSNLAVDFKSDGEEKEWDEYETIEFILSYVQSIPYMLDNDTGYDEYPRYPIETLVDGGGDCEDLVFLFISIVRELDYGVAILMFGESEHTAAAIKVTQDFINNWQYEYPLTYYEATSGNKYAYCETTAFGYGIGEKPNSITGNPEIIDVSKD